MPPAPQPMPQPIQPPGPTVYDDPTPPADLQRDARAVGVRLRLDRVARAAERGAPSLSFADFPQDTGKVAVRVDEAAARLAQAIYG